jgi:hypothetical protein
MGVTNAFFVLVNSVAMALSLFVLQGIDFTMSSGNVFFHLLIGDCGG